MQKVAHGDKQASSVLYDALAPLVFGNVVNVVRDRAQSEEVAQEVMIDLWRFGRPLPPRSRTCHHLSGDDRPPAGRGPGPLQAAADREQAQAAREHTTAYEEVAEQVETP